MIENTDAEVDQDEEGGLSPKEERALQALLSEPTLKAAAEAAGVSETTMWRYRRDEKFTRRLREARRDAAELTTLRLQSSAGDAVSVLNDPMRSEDAPAGARIAAARSIIEYSVRVSEVGELREQVEELREYLRAKQDEDAVESAIN